MCSSKTVRVGLATIIEVLVICTSLQSNACAQDDPIELLRRMPPDPAIMNESYLASAKVTLEWQIRRGTMNLQRLETEMERLEKQIEDLEAASVSIAKESQLNGYAFTSDAVRDQLLGRVLGRLLEARADIAANEALEQHLEEQLKDVAPDESAQEQRKAQRGALHKKLMLLSADAERLKTLRERDVVSDRELLNAQVEIHHVEADIAALVADEEASARRKAAEIASPLANIRLHLHELRARARMSELQLKELADAADVARQVRRIQREVDRLIERLDIRTGRYEEISMEMVEPKLLLQEIAAATKGSNKQPVTSNAKD